MLLALTVQAEERIQFPAGYKDNILKYLSLDRTRKDGRIIRLFATKETLVADQAGKELPYGTVLVAELYKAKKDADGEVIESALGRRIPGKFAAFAVMQKGEGWGEKFSPEFRNGDWDYAIFSPKGERLVVKDLNDFCACRQPFAKTQHLFSLEHMVN